MGSLPAILLGFALGGLFGAYEGGLKKGLAASADFIAADNAVWEHPDGAAAGVKALASLLA